MIHHNWCVHSRIEHSDSHLDIFIRTTWQIENEKKNHFRNTCARSARLNLPHGRGDCSLFESKICLLYKWWRAHTVWHSHSPAFNARLIYFYYILYENRPKGRDETNYAGIWSTDPIYLGIKPNARHTRAYKLWACDLGRWLLQSESICFFFPIKRNYYSRLFAKHTNTRTHTQTGRYVVVVKVVQCATYTQTQQTHNANMCGCKSYDWFLYRNCDLSFGEWNHKTASALLRMQRQAIDLSATNWNYCPKKCVRESKCEM